MLPFYFVYTFCKGDFNLQIHFFKQLNKEVSTGNLQKCSAIQTLPISLNKIILQILGLQEENQADIQQEVEGPRKDVLIVTGGKIKSWKLDAILVIDLNGRTFMTCVQCAIINVQDLNDDSE